MKSGKYHIVFNGEIYNFKELRDELLILGYKFKTESDTEVILIGYQYWGESVVDHLDGMFSFIIYDLNKNVLFGSRDRLGVKPLYYSYVNNTFEACSQLRPISENKQICEEALNMYYDLGYIPAPYSIYKDVKKLKAGNCFRLDLELGDLKTWPYWDIKPLLKDDFNSIRKEELFSILEDSVNKRLISDVPLCVFLSGGIDSTLVAKIANDKKTNLASYTIGFNSKELDETKKATLISKKLRLNNKIYRFDNQDLIAELKKHVLVFDEPFSDSTSIGTLLVNKNASKKITVALSGDGGDESFFGYNHFVWLKYYLLIEFIPRKVRVFLSKILLELSKLSGKQKLFNISKLLSGSRIDLMKNVFLGFNRLSLKKNDFWFDKHFRKYLSYSTSPYQQLSDLTTKLWLEGDSNVKVDRASMAYSIEVRSPFLDYKLIEKMREINVSLRYRKNILKKILTDIGFEKKFFDKKKGFTMPIEEWTKKDLKELIITELSDEFLYSLPGFNVQKFKKMLTNHMNGKTNYSSFIWRIFILKLWFNDISIEK